MWQNLTSILLAFNIHITQALPQTIEGQHDQLIVWNIGQGQWVSVSLAQICVHFDMGGENAHWLEISRECGEKKNLAYFSHWDVDHLSFALPASKHLNSFCVAAMPRGPCTSEKKRKAFSELRKCLNASPENIEQIFQLPDHEMNHFSSNDYSRVFEYNHWMLAQGDSPQRQEKNWIRDIHSPELIRVIILGHHGSRTSTSEALLAALPNLKMAIASARKSRYGHPHQEVLNRLKKFGIACLRTEYWGNIHIELPKNDFSEERARSIKNARSN